ncbi:MULTISPECIES: rolling circle replication-associated protein [Bradyrhizobium]|uniref:rolling circle replication-associated protein n=1 Tax=Bradyrhizobium TaxID=374 RepID=UPI0012BC29E5|nr:MULTISPECIES: hypothetical protein [Bradyrhizobium]MCS3445015.1 hypothetical protein [Bradyrhizobium elkanii]MCS3563854.1 hypothetical protein [Bradyrhizobium elkanii]MCW2146311.1 hypothetical protein [Bradyrhizobium elkanii]MCW2354616.1 hypothetical protein [Bradyrhizobium elkanii]MCW2379141.1 hypothetical protein [Bradyrhizobium elkanii]
MSVSEGGDPLLVYLERLRSEAREWCHRAISDWNSRLFISLNFKTTMRGDLGNLISLDEHIACSEIKRFGNRLDRAVHRGLVQRFNRRVRRIPFLEYGHDRGWHAHLLIEKPEDMLDVRFLQIVKKAWSVSPWSTNFHSREVDDEGPAYLTKYRSKSELEAWTDTIVLEAVVVDTK